MDRHPGPRIAFFGGSFDPPHRGHIEVAKAARDALRLETVLFAPVGAQPLKTAGSTARFAERVAMTRLAIEGERAFAVSMADAPQPEGKPNYTLDTLRRLRAEIPAGGELFCLMGADSFAMLRKWHRAAEIPFAASLIVASRPGQTLSDLEALLPQGVLMEQEKEPEAAGPTAVRTFELRNGEGQSAWFHLLPGLEIPISATEIRAEIAATGCSAAVPEKVAEYIRAHALYR